MTKDLVSVENFLKRLLIKLEAAKLRQLKLTVRGLPREYFDGLTHALTEAKKARRNLAALELLEIPTLEMKQAASNAGSEGLRVAESMAQNSLVDLIDVLGWPFVTLVAEAIIKVLADPPKAVKALSRLESVEQSDAHPLRFAVFAYLSPDKDPEVLLSEILKYLQDHQVVVENFGRTREVYGSDVEDYKDGAWLIVRVSDYKTILNLRSDKIIPGAYLGQAFEMR